MSVTLSRRPGRWYRRLGVAVLVVVAATGAVLSWESLYQAASVHLGQASPYVTIGGSRINAVGAVFSVLLDGLILAASLLYVAGVKAQRPVAGWRAAAHAGIAGTVLANVAAAQSPADILWHVVPPAVWALVVELTARDILGELREVRQSVAADRISWKLWVTSPAEQARTMWRMLRTLEASAQTARVEADRCAATSVALGMALPGLRNRKRRRRITRRMWAGTLSPADVFAAVDAGGTPDEIVRRALRAVLPGAVETAPVVVTVDPVVSIPAPATPIERPVAVEPIESIRLPIEEPIELVESIRSGVDPVESSDRVEPIHSIRPIGSGSVEGSIRPTGSTGAVALSVVAGRVEEPIESGAGAARPDDVARLLRAIQSGEVKRPLKVEHVRTTLKIGPKYARAAVAAVEAMGTEQRRTAQG